MAEVKITATSGGGTVALKGPATTNSDAAVNVTLPKADIDLTGGSNGQYLKTNGSGTLSWGTVDTTTTSGTDNFTVADGNLVIGTAGHGIDFSATADADSGGETISNIDEVLDDYDEGRWTPTLKYSGAANCTTNSYSPKGRYVKVGQLVFVSGYIALTAKGSDNGSGYLEIHGLPFSSDQYAQPDRPAYSGLSAYWGNFSSVKNLGIVWGNNNDKCYICGGDGESTLQQYGILTDTSWLAFSLTYRASA